VEDNGGVYFVPALTGLGAPHWNANARGTVSGITRGTTRGHLARATLESIAYQSFDVAQAMAADSGIQLKELRVDGGASSNNLLMQFQADILGAKVVRPENRETTALGAAFFAGLATGIWKNTHELSSLWKVDQRFKDNMEESERNNLLKKWSKAVQRAKDWAE
jgi:glycerol kinase